MTDQEFDEHVTTTEKRDDDTVAGLDYCLLKLCAEAGEVAGLRGKEILLRTPTTNAPERLAAYALELGDVRWYTVEAERLLGLTADQVKRLNVMKLRRRRDGAGKDPAGELAEAIAILSAPANADTKPVECMAEHSYAQGCPLVCGTPTRCGRDGCSRTGTLDEFQRWCGRDGCSRTGTLDEFQRWCGRDGCSRTGTLDEFQRCSYCEDWTRHRAESLHYQDEPLTPVCRAPECRDQHRRMQQRESCE